MYVFGAGEQRDFLIADSFLSVCLGLAALEYLPINPAILLHFNAHQEHLATGTVTRKIYGYYEHVLSALKSPLDSPHAITVDDDENPFFALPMSWLVEHCVRSVSLYSAGHGRQRKEPAR